jgi:RNA polymerase sigma-70 factor (ECF subfamily)
MSDRERLEALFGEHARAVRAYALRRVDAATADDVVSEVFVVACRRLQDVPSDDALPWLLGCARRVLANQQRGGRRRAALSRRLQTDAADAREHAPVASPDGVLARALDRLSARDRELLMLIAWEELDPVSAARVLGCSRGALAVRLHRARRRLADALVREQESPASCVPTVEVDR